MKKERWTEWGRRLGGALLIGVFATELLMSGNVGYSAVETALLFSVLFMGYKYGAGAGAVCGTGCGIILTLFTKSMGSLGIFSMIGVMAGAFRSLGRIASVLAYLAAAVGVAVIYAPALLYDSAAKLAAAAAVFLILPRSLCGPEGVEERKKEVTPPRGDFDGSLGRRLKLMEDSLLELSRAFYQGRPETAEEEKDGDAIGWRTRYFENRAVMGEQLTEVAELLKGFRGELDKTVDVTWKLEKQIARKLRSIKLRADKIAVWEENREKYQVVLRASARSGRSVTVKEVADAVSQVVGKTLCPSADGVNVISSVPRVVRLEEETVYRMLHGVARCVKGEENVSGDSFSYMELPGGKVLLSLCDGMGSGQNAFYESSRAIELTEQLIQAGFQPGTVVRLVNQALVMQDSLHPLTMDMAVADLYSGLCDFTKSGAAVTLIRRGGEIELLQSESLPLGVLKETQPAESMYRLRDGDLIIMMTDGVLEAMPGLDKEGSMKAFCLDLPAANPREVARRVLDYALDQGEARDDMTVLVAGMWKK